MVFLPNTSLNEDFLPSEIIPYYDWLSSLIDDTLIDQLADTVYDKSCLLVVDIVLVSVIYIVLYILAKSEGSCKPKGDP